MINYQKAYVRFEAYIHDYDLSIPLLNLKVIHTYKVVELMEDLSIRLHLNKEETELAKVIGLLHDLGRFEQYVRYQSFVDYQTIDHAELSADLLFKDKLIEEFVIERKYDFIIEQSLRQHNKYQPQYFDEKTNLFINMIRDADKIDNYRVRREEKIETILGESIEEVERETITPIIYEQFIKEELIYMPNRQTKLDYWISYNAFIFDMNFKESLTYLKEHHEVEESFDRIKPQNKETLKHYIKCKEIALNYMNR